MKEVLKKFACILQEGQIRHAPFISLIQFWRFHGKKDCWSIHPMLSWTVQEREILSGKRPEEQSYLNQGFANRWKAD